MVHSPIIPDKRGGNDGNHIISGNLPKVRNGGTFFSEFLFTVLILFTPVSSVFAVLSGWSPYPLLLLPLEVYTFGWFFLIFARSYPHYNRRLGIVIYPLGNAEEIGRGLFIFSAVEMALIIWTGIDATVHPQLINYHIGLYIITVAAINFYSVYFVQIKLTRAYIGFSDNRGISDSIGYFYLEPDDPRIIGYFGLGDEQNKRNTVFSYVIFISLISVLYVMYILGVLGIYSGVGVFIPGSEVYGILLYVPPIVIIAPIITAIWRIMVIYKNVRDFKREVPKKVRLTSELGGLKRDTLEAYISHIG